MALTVLDSNNLEAMVRDATGEGLTPPPLPKDSGVEAAQPKAADAEHAQDTDADDSPGEDGLTPREKRELSAKMQKAISKRVRQVREAEEFAGEEMRARRDAERRAEALERELQALRSNAQPAQPEAPAAVPDKPQRQNFASDEAYIEALTDFRVAEKLAQKEAADAKAREQAEAQAQLDAKNARIAKAIELVPDFQEVTQDAKLQVPLPVAGYLMQSEMVAELGYFLAQNPEVVAALHKMTPERALVEIGKIEGKLPPFAAAKATDGAKPSTKQELDTDGKLDAKPAPRKAAGEGADPSAARRAAPVITPISTSSNGAMQLDPETATVRDHIAEFHRKRGVNLNRRQRH